jgi:hypothetical protein
MRIKSPNGDLIGSGNAVTGQMAGQVDDAAEREKLVALRREALEAMNPPRNPPNGGLLDSGHLAGFRSAGPPLRCCPAAPEGGQGGSP